MCDVDLGEDAIDLSCGCKTSTLAGRYFQLLAAPVS
jgi:hypothetical protein